MDDQTAALIPKDEVDRILNAPTEEERLAAEKALLVETDNGVQPTDPEQPW